MFGVVEVAQEPPTGHSAIDATSSDRPSPAASRIGEMPVVGLPGQSILEHHQGRHHVGALDVADVDAFDAQRRIGKTERFPECSAGRRIWR